MNTIPVQKIPEHESSTKGGFLSLPFCSNNCMCDKEGSTSRGKGWGERRRVGEKERERSEGEIRGQERGWGNEGRGGERHGKRVGKRGRGNDRG